MTIVISATVCTEDDARAARASEVLARAAAGLALDGIDCAVTMNTVDDDEEGDAG